MGNIKLTVKQRRFADEYVKSGNATQSYIDAGYSVTTREVAEANGRRLLGNERVRRYLVEINKKIQDESIADMTEIKQFWSTVTRGEEMEMKDRLKASELIARTNAAFVDKVEHSGNMEINNPMADLSTEELRRLIDK